MDSEDDRSMSAIWCDGNSSDHTADTIVPRRASDLSDITSVTTEDEVCSLSNDWTTLKLTGFPTHFSRLQLLALLDAEELCGLYDFVYLPSDFKITGRCFGYAFVNFLSGEAALLAHRRLQVLDAGSEQALRVSWADLQGLSAHIDRFRNSPVMHKTVPNDAKPAVFKGGVHVPFPAPTTKIPHPRSNRRASHNHATSGVGYSDTDSAETART